MTPTEKYIRDRLFAMQDLKYRDFHSGLMPTVEKELVIGVRTPELRKLAKELSETDTAAAFINILPHRYYEENNLHAFLICGIKDYDVLITRLNEFLPFVDNWATCDMMRPAAFAKNKERLLPEIRRWMQSEEPYTVRFGIEMLMLHFLEDDFDISYAQAVAAIRSDEYYVKMMVAWYFATALAKQYEATVPYIENRLIKDKWTHNKAIQKAMESYRVSNDKKEHLKSLKY